MIGHFSTYVRLVTSIMWHDKRENFENHKAYCVDMQTWWYKQCEEENYAKSRTAWGHIYGSPGMAGSLNDDSMSESFIVDVKFWSPCHNWLVRTISKSHYMEPCHYTYVIKHYLWCSIRLVGHTGNRPPFPLCAVRIGVCALQRTCVHCIFGEFPLCVT